MKYFVKTVHGTSSEFYRVLRDYLLYGTGQGSGASPSIWLSLVIVLLTSLTILTPLAMSFVDPWEDIFEERNVDSFVDDTSNGCNDGQQEEAMSIQGTDCEGTGDGSNLGMYPVQFGQGSGATEMFLEFAILDMGERSSAAGDED
jgi:hypothetical protein